MNIAIVGSSGYISGYLITRFEGDKSIGKVLKIGRTKGADAYLDLQEAGKFDYSVLDDIDYAIFTAAISGPDKCAAEFGLCWSVNVAGTSCFIREAISRNCRVLFFSSDAVFGDIPGEIYTEESETKAATPYGRMKKAVEDEFMGNSNFKAIRLSYVVSAKDRYVAYCLDCMGKREAADVFHPFYRNCISAGDVVDVVSWFVSHWDDYGPSVLNVAGKELVSRVRIADEINRCLGNKLEYSISKPDGAFYQNRPPITQMRSLYMQEYHILQDSTFTEKIKKELEVVKNDY